MSTVESSSGKKRDASDVYDRQIRLWGKEAQEKMQKAKVLYVNVTGISSEIIKNLVLAGVRATICDTRSFPSAVSDTPSFLLPPAVTEEDPVVKKAKHSSYDTVGEALKPVIEQMNLLLGECEILHKNVADLDAEILKGYPIVVASRICPSEATRLAKIITAAGNKLFVADCFGIYGGSMIDLGKHEYRPELGKQLLDPKQLEPQIPLHEILQTPLQDAVNRFHKQHPPPTWMRYRAILQYCDMNNNQWPTAADADDFAIKINAWIQETSPKLIDHEIFQPESLKALAKIASAEIVPVCAVLGGIIGNEVIKAISGKGEPANNTLFFDAESCKAWTFLVRRKVEDEK